MLAQHLESQNGYMEALKHIPEHEDPSVQHVNRLPARAHLSVIPTKERQLSLNGSWRFSIAPTTTDSLNSPTSWSKIDVPGHWQLQGFGAPPWYTNQSYPFPVDPPRVSTANEVGIYERTFELPSKSWYDKRILLRFDGVDSAFHVYLNAHEIGFSKGSRLASEFDITEHVKTNGKNTLRVHVIRWSDGSYLEDQDQWWLSGIFRDVTLLAYNKLGSIIDVRTHSGFDKDYKNATLNVSIKTNGSGGVLKAELMDSTAQIVANAISDQTSGELIIYVANCLTWTAETPNLYKLKLVLLDADKSPIDETLLNIGLREVKVHDRRIMINGKPIQLRGVNRHDHHPKYGRAVPIDFVRQDLITMKSNNINAVRTSHYPNAPDVYDLFDELGFYVMAECDLECHGFDVTSSPAKWTSDNPVWRKAYLDRIERTVLRDYNHASIFAWSLGNESFLGRNHRSMAAWIRDVDPSRLVHYEPDSRPDFTDFRSAMYRTPEDLTDMCKDSTSPVILCEYGHAMGNGPGSLEEYRKVFETERAAAGGFIWEWASHGLLQKTSEGVPFMAHGGDFPTEPNDGNFVLDGLCDSDHVPQPTLAQLKHAYRPVDVVLKDGQLVFTNAHAHVSLSRLTCTYELYKVSLRDRARGLLGSGKLTLPILSPGETGCVKVPRPGPIRGDDEHILRITLTDDAPRIAELAPKHEVASFSFLITPWRKPDLPSSQLSKMTIVDDSATFEVVGPRATFRFDKRYGCLVGWMHDGRHVMPEWSTSATPDSRSGGLRSGFWRAPIDNDLRGTDAAYWKSLGVDRLSESVRDVSLDSSDPTRVRVSVSSSWAPTGKAWRFDILTRYLISMTEDGKSILQLDQIVTPASLEPSTEMPDTLPRSGLNFPLAAGFDTCEWSGLGPSQSYPDACAGCVVNLHILPTDKMFYRYESPQESGNRHATRWFSLVKQAGYFNRQIVLRGYATTQDLFDFAVLPYADAEIEKAKHPHELQSLPSATMILRLDRQVNGLGSGACGPGVRDEYKNKVKKYRFGVVLEASAY
ncbi:Beta-galactosidase (Lactase) [Savitreella phatthalungensis]